MDFHTGLKPHAIRYGAFADITGNGRYRGKAHYTQQPVCCDGKDKVGSRSGGSDGNTLTRRLGGKRFMALFFRDRALALVQHFDVATQGDQRDSKLGPVAVITRENRITKAYRKAQYLDAALAGNPEVPELVDGHQNAKGDNQCQYCLQNV